MKFQRIFLMYLFCNYFAMMYACEVAQNILILNKCTQFWMSKCTLHYRCKFLIRLLKQRLIQISHLLFSLFKLINSSNYIEVRFTFTYNHRPQTVLRTILQLSNSRITTGLQVKTQVLALQTIRLNHRSKPQKKKQHSAKPRPKSFPGPQNG